MTARPAGIEPATIGLAFLSPPPFSLSSCSFFPQPIPACRVREISNEEGTAAADRASSVGVGGDVAAGADGAAVARAWTWRIAKVAFTSADRVRTCAQLQRRRVRLAATRSTSAAGRRRSTLLTRRDQEDRAGSPGRSRAAVLDLGLSKLAEYLVAEGVVEDISHEGLRVLLRERGRLVSRPSRPGRPAPTPTTRRRRTGSCPVRHRRPQDQPSASVIPRGDLHGRVRAAQPAAPPRQAVGPRAAGTGDQPAAAAPAARHLKRPHGCGTCWPPTTCPPTALRPHQDPQGPHQFLAFCRYLRSSTRPTCGSRSCWTTSARTCPPTTTPGR